MLGPRWANLPATRQTAMCGPAPSDPVAAILPANWQKQGRFLFLPPKSARSDKQYRFGPIGCTKLPERVSRERPLAAMGASREGTGRPVGRARSALQPPAVSFAIHATARKAHAIREMAGARVRTNTIMSDR